MKKYIILIILFFVADLSAQNPFSLRGVFGLATIDEQVWGQFALRPTLDFGKIKVGLDLILYIDQNGKLHQYEWDFSNGTATKNTILDKIYFFQYASPYEPLYLRVGALPRTTLGFGILASRYSNTFNYPQFRKIGLTASLRTKSINLKGFVNDFKENASVIGLRASRAIPFGMQLGISLVTDRNQYCGLQDRDYDGRPDIVDSFPDVDNIDVIHSYWDSLGTAVGRDFSSEPFYDSIPDHNIILKNEPINILQNPKSISALAIDISIPIIQSKSASLAIYSQAAKMFGETVNPATGADEALKYGFSPIGVFNRFGIFSWQAEYRVIPVGNFDFEYWDRAYEHNRATVSSIDNGTTSIQVTAKSDKLGEFGTMRGIFGRIDIDLNEGILIGATYQNLIGDKWNSETNAFEKQTIESFLASAELLQPIDRIVTASAFYQQRNVPNPFKFEPTESTIMGISVGAKVGLGMILTYSYKRSYQDKNGDGDVLDADEVINISLLETSIGF